jgi:hypothetical protein
MSSVAAQLTVVHRRDCELCDEMLAALARLKTTLQLPAIAVVDVDGDPGLDVPVLLLDGTVVCRHRLDESELRRLLRHSSVA